VRELNREQRAYAALHWRLWYVGPRYSSEKPIVTSKILRAEGVVMPRNATATYNLVLELIANPPETV